MSDAALELSHVDRTYGSGQSALQVLKSVDLRVARGEAVALLGPSGSGKSTLLHTAGLLERAEGGTVAIGGTHADALSDEARTKLRRHKVGFVYQFHHLLPELTALENAAMPLRIAGAARGEALARAGGLLDALGVGARGEHRPAALSGGERQRVAIARALVHRPSLLLADEPTGNLDGKTSEAVGALLLDVARREGAGVLVATHDEVFAARMDRAVRLEEGGLVPAAL